MILSNNVEIAQEVNRELSIISWFKLEITQGAISRICHKTSWNFEINYHEFPINYMLYSMRSDLILVRKLQKSGTLTPQVTCNSCRTSLTQLFHEVLHGHRSFAWWRPFPCGRRHFHCLHGLFDDGHRHRIGCRHCRLCHHDRRGCGLPVQRS